MVQSNVKPKLGIIPRYISMVRGPGVNFDDIRYKKIWDSDSDVCDNVMLVTDLRCWCQSVTDRAIMLVIFSIF